LKRQKLLTKKREKPIIILLDDNMFYKSMRYSYYQLAEQYTLGYCIIYLKCAFDTSFARLKQRADGHLIELSARRIADQLEVPDASKEKWEQFSQEFDSSGGEYLSSLEVFERFISTCVDFPVQSNKLTDVELEKRELDRKMNRENLIHQADLCLRKIVGEMSKEIGGSGDVDKKDKDIRMKKIVLGRKLFIADMKTTDFDFTPFLDQSGQVLKDALLCELRNRLNHETTDRT